MEMRDYVALGRKWLWLMVLAAVVAAVSAWVATQFMPRTYRSQATVMVGRQNSQENPDYSTVYLSQSLAESYAQMATRQPVLDGAVKALGLNASWQQLRGMVQARPVPGSQLFEITVIDTDPLRAQLVADAVAKQVVVQSPTPTERDKLENSEFVRAEQADLRAQIEAAKTEIADLDAKMGLETSARAIADLQSRRQARSTQIESWRNQFAQLGAVVEGSRVNSLDIIEPATPGSQVGPNVGMNVLLAALIGLGLALGAALILEYMDDTVKTSDMAQRRLGLPALGTAARLEGVQERADVLVAATSPRSPSAEAFRTLRTNLQFALLEQSQATLLVTSANPGEGKTSVVANLGAVLAQSGQRVVLVDADLRRPTLHRVFGLTNSLGLTSLLLDDGLTPADALQPVESSPGLAVLTSGPLPPNPSEVLASKAMVRLLARLADEADVVVLDSPPLLAVTDPAILARRADGTLLVVDAGATHTKVVRKAIDVLAQVGVKPVGVVLNKQDRRAVSGSSDAYRYDYDYSGYYGEPGGRPPARGQPVERGMAPGWWARVRQVMTSFLS